MEKVNCRTCVYFCQMEKYHEYEQDTVIVDCCTHYDNRVIKPSYVGMAFNGKFIYHPSLINADNNCQNYLRLSDGCISKYAFLFNI